MSIATLGLGIGAATAIFSVVDNVLLSPFPYKGAGRMVFPRIHNAGQGQEGGRQGYTAIFACIGLVLVTVGVYSVLAYSTAQRTHEIGIRMALGAEGEDVLGMVVKTGLRLVVVGMAIGLAVSLVLARLIGTELVGVSAYDPTTLAATTLLLTMTAAVACWIPARRAARVDPMVALRYE